jgi:hypoxanthine-DNA glycosylase
MESISFAPIIDKNSRILILGTMPGMMSLEKQKYYAHERNTFWPIIFKLFDTIYSSEYQARIKLLINNKLALWDTLQYCIRKGSLDSDIQQAKPNDVNALLKEYTQIKTIVFNGKYAEKFYKKFQKKVDEIQYLSMPSTSPANARLTFSQKFDKWSELKNML